MEKKIDGHSLNDFEVIQLNPRTFPHPSEVLLSFFLDDKSYQHLTFSVAVRFSLARILKQVNGVQLLCLGDMTSSVANGQVDFEWKCLFSQLLLTSKVTIVDTMMQSAYLCVISHVKHQKLPFLAILTWFLILGKIQAAYVDVVDGKHCWWRHRPPVGPSATKYTSSCREDREASYWRQNLFEMLQHIEKL